MFGLTIAIVKFAMRSTQSMRSKNESGVERPVLADSCRINILLSFELSRLVKAVLSRTI